MLLYLVRIRRMLFPACFYYLSHSNLIQAWSASLGFLKTLYWKNEVNKRKLLFIHLRQFDSFRAGSCAYIMPINRNFYLKYILHRRQVGGKSIAGRRGRPERRAVKK